MNKIINNLNGDRLFPSWNIVGAKTGRIITTKPNLNSTPRLSIFRQMFIAKEFRVCDFAMIEITGLVNETR